MLPFVEKDGVFTSGGQSGHRDEEYDERGIEILARMQRRHFWYLGRHKLILSVLRHELKQAFQSEGLAGIDLGGGCGGWVQYLSENKPGLFSRMALGDSSLRALNHAKSSVGQHAELYQIDVANLPWNKEWDVIFLLDVLEHIPADEKALGELLKCLKPGGLLFVTTPALRFFWSYNDEVARHQRRYSKNDYKRLAERLGVRLVRSEYFMFFLSPALLVNRLFHKPPPSSSEQERFAFLERTHRIPRQPINWGLAKIFELEAFLVNTLSFPWGTSILTVLQRPPDNP